MNTRLDKILINSLGIQDSGGVVVFDHLLDDIKITSFEFLIVWNSG
jgi:hypothetical protein